MRAHRSRKGHSVQRSRRQVKASLGRGLAVAGHARLDHAQHGEAWEGYLIRMAPVRNDPTDVAADGMAPDLDPSMIGVCVVCLSSGWLAGPANMPAAAVRWRWSWGAFLRELFGAAMIGGWGVRRDPGSDYPADPLHRCSNLMAPPPPAAAWTRRGC